METIASKVHSHTVILDAFMDWFRQLLHSFSPKDWKELYSLADVKKSISKIEVIAFREDIVCFSCAIQSYPFVNSLIEPVRSSNPNRIQLRFRDR